MVHPGFGVSLSHGKNLPLMKRRELISGHDDFG